MTKIVFNKEQKDQLMNKLQSYFEQELEHEIGQFDAEFLLDFISKEMGAIYYNQGLFDAQAFMQKKIDTIVDEMYELEK